MARLSPRPMISSLLVAFAAIVLPATAVADGLPLPVDTSKSSVQSPGGGPFRYFAVRAPGGSIVIKLAADGSEVVRRAYIPRRSKSAPAYVVPAVAYDGSVGGLSADGETLALIEPRRRFPRDTTSFLLLDAEKLEVAGHFTLEGDFSFDAISRDGSTLYLAHYLDRRDPSRYEVRAYDVESGRLLSEPIVSREIVEIQMRGLPLTRATSPDGTWEYTAYDGNYRTPFIHALNVDTGHALCINLSDHLQRNELPPTLSIDPAGATITVTSFQGDQVAAIDTETFDVSSIREAADSSPDEAGIAAWIWLIAGVGVFASAVTARRILRRRRSRRTEVELSRLDFEADAYRGGDERGSGSRDPLRSARAGDADLRLRR